MPVLFAGFFEMLVSFNAWLLSSNSENISLDHEAETDIRDYTKYTPCIFMNLFII